MTAVRREGFSLMEVILAMSILLGGVIVLGRLAAIGSRHARDAEDLATAQLLCEARMSEVLAGILAPEEAHEQPLPEAPGWVVSTELLPLAQPGIVELRITVLRESDLTPSLEDEPEQSGKPVTVTLVRWIPVPGVESQNGQSTPEFENLPATGEVFAP